MEQRTLKNVKNYCNTNIYSYLETSGDQSFNLYFNVAHFFSTHFNQTPVAAYDCCCPALVSNIPCSIGSVFTINDDENYKLLIKFRKICKKSGTIWQISK